MPDPGLDLGDPGRVERALADLHQRGRGYAPKLGHGLAREDLDATPELEPALV